MIDKEAYLNSWMQIHEMKEPVLDIEFIEHSHTEKGITAKGKKYWTKYAKYKCHCGNLFISRVTSINAGNVVSCGCLAHGNQSKTKVIEEL